MTTYKAIHLIARPGEKALGPELFEVREHPTPEVKPGELLVKQSHMSLDPAMLGWMSADPDSYIPPVELGAVMRSFGIGQVIKSAHPDFAEGDQVTGSFGWSELCLSQGQGLNKLDSSVNPEMALSVFSLPGLTAVQGLFNVGQPKAGETLVVSGAAGSVGSIVGQLAKADGLKVIGVAGGEEKCRWITDTLGFDAAIDYRKHDVASELERLTPEGIDIYFENTGGAIQHAAMQRMNAHGRIIVCGLISQYLAKEPEPGPHWINIIKKRLRIEGFTMPDHLHNTPALLEKLTPYVMQGKIKYRAHVLEGLEAAMSGLNLFFDGSNKGKLMVKL